MEMTYEELYRQGSRLGEQCEEFQKHFRKINELFDDLAGRVRSFDDGNVLQSNINKCKAALYSSYTKLYDSSLNLSKNIVQYSMDVAKSSETLSKYIMNYKPGDPSNGVPFKGQGTVIPNTSTENFSNFVNQNLNK